MKYFVEYTNPWDYSYSTSGSSSSYPSSTFPENFSYFCMNWGHAGVYDGWFFEDRANMSGTQNYTELTQLAIFSISKPPKQPKSIDAKILKAR